MYNRQNFPKGMKWSLTIPASMFLLSAPKIIVILAIVVFLHP